MYGLALGLLIFLNSNLTVFVTYFAPFGTERGVGPDVLVQVDAYGQPPRYCTTDVDSSCTVKNLPSSDEFQPFVSVTAFYHDDNPFFHFVCQDVAKLDHPEEYLIVQCRRVFAWLPHVTAPVQKE